MRLRRQRLMPLCRSVLIDLILKPSRIIKHNILPICCTNLGEAPVHVGYEETSSPSFSWLKIGTVAPWIIRSSPAEDYKPPHPMMCRKFSADTGALGFSIDRTSAFLKLSNRPMLWFPLSIPRRL